MSPNEQPTRPQNVPPVGVELKDSSVSIVGLNPKLDAFLVTLGLVYLHLFGRPAIVTCAVDKKIHRTGKHPIGDAIDLRISDHSGFEHACAMLVLGVLGQRFGLGVFDESMLVAGPHVHIEVL